MEIANTVHESKHYRILGRKDAHVLADLRQHLSQHFFYREFVLFEKSGGRSGDLAEEIMEFELHVAGSEGGRTRGMVAVYSVVDNSCNGYAHLMSVLISLPTDYEELPSLLKYLQDAMFVSNYSSFKERPAGYRRFLSYLDNMPELNVRDQLYSDDGHGTKKRTAQVA